MLVFDLALGIDSLDDILTRHSLTHPDFQALENNLTFRRDLLRAHKEIAEEGVSFRRKAAIQAEEYLTYIHTIMTSNETPASTKVDIFKTLTKFGNLEPKKDKEAEEQAGQTFNIQINL